MKNILYFFLIIIFLPFSNCTQTERNDKQFTLKGQIIDQDSGVIILQYGVFSAFHSDTVTVTNGIFSFSGKIKEPTLGFIQVNNKSNRTQLFLEPAVMKITLSNRNFKEFTLTGSDSHEELIRINKSLQSTDNRDSILLKFVLNNPKSYLTPYYLTDLGYRSKLSLDSIKLILNGLDLSVQNSRYGRMTLGVIRCNENTTPGNYATDFKANDVKNQTLTLSQFKNKNIVLLDFWASWCVPCRESFPHIKELYNKYHSNGLEIIGIASLDIDKKSWESAIKEDSIHIWHHIATQFRDGTTMNEDIAFDYPIGPIPRTILIDKDGKVVGNWVGQSKENEISIDNKLAMIFDK